MNELVNQSRGMSPLPRKRGGEGWGEGLLAATLHLPVGRKIALTRTPRNAPLPTSPRRRGEVIGALNDWPHAEHPQRPGGQLRRDGCREKQSAD